MDTASPAATAPPLVIGKPELGQLAEVRRRRWVVTDVVGGGAPAVAPAAIPADVDLQHLVTLSSVEDDGLGEELQVVWELEPGARVLERVALPEPTGFDEPRRLDAFLDAVRWGAASSADVRALQSPFRSGIQIEDYQLDPVVRAVQMPRVNLLIADDVGLGKTIEAGLVIQELIVRHRARRVLIVCPASLVIQWRDQMRDKFGLEFRIVDTELLKRLRRERGVHVNPWAHFPRLITSIDWIKREKPLRMLREVLPGPSDPIYPRRFDVLVVDEAHNVAPPGRGHYATDSDRTIAIRTLAPHCEHRLFLTATPHNGYRESFSALLELLDPQRFARDVVPDPAQLNAVMVRRLKKELPPRWNGSPRFPKREIEAIEVTYTAAEREAHGLLEQYRKARQSRAVEHAEELATNFVLKLLKKRLFSSPAAFHSTLEQHQRSLRDARRRRTGAEATASVRVLRRLIDKTEEEASDDESLVQATGDAIAGAARLFSEPTADERDLLNRLATWASAAANRADSKADALIRWLDSSLRPAGKWSDRRVILFTEYRDTQKWLQTLLAAAGLTEGERLLVMYGGMPSDERERIKAAFQARPSVSPVRILLATDSASEGIDLQNHCSMLIHYEIPWNPNRMEQRNGRVDRHGQRAPEVRVFHFVGSGYLERQKQAREALEPGELEGDVEFLMRAAIKVEQIREDLGSVGDVIADQVEEAMLGRRKRLDTRSAEGRAKPVREMLRFREALKERIEKLLEQLQETRRSLRLDPENIQTVVEMALELAGQPPLRGAKLPGVWPDPSGRRTRCPVFFLPALRGSWAECTLGLMHPHTQEVRPIVFDHALAENRDDVVLVHLNHRLVQMSLRLLRAEVWAPAEHKKIHRITARVVADPMLETPAVVAHARLVIIGGNAHRLHEEVITAGGVLREGRFARMNVTDLDRALAAASAHQPDAPVKARLLDLWPTFKKPLEASLEARVRDRAISLANLLADRVEKETRDITAVLTELRGAILAELDSEPPTQLELWSKAEVDQRDLNIHELRRRADEIPAEIEAETKAIQARFADPQSRVFPVAVTFLVPERMSRG